MIMEIKYIVLLHSILMCNFVHTQLRKPHVKIPRYACISSNQYASILWDLYYILYILLYSGNSVMKIRTTEGDSRSVTFIKSSLLKTTQPILPRKRCVCSS